LEIAVATVENDVVVAVSDHDPSPDEAADKPLRGRSKALVVALADDYGTLSDVRSRTVWVLLREHGKANSAGTLEATTIRG
jgi:hypothetical protein